MSNDLNKSLNLFDIFCIASGAMISSGLFILPGIVFAHTGPAIIISYLLAGVLCLPGMLSLAEMTTAMPKAGGDCFTIIRSLGPGVGTVSGLLSWFSLAMKSAFALVGMSLFTELLLNINVNIIAVFFCILFLALNLIGIKEAGKVQNVLVIALLLIMTGYIILGLPHIDKERFFPLIPYGTNSIFYTTGLVFVSYAGLLKIASIAEEIKNPARNIPLGMMLSNIVVVLFYIFMISVTIGVLPADKLSNNIRPLTDGAAVFSGKAGGILLTFAAIFAFLSTANAGIMTSARSLVPLSRDNLFPKMFSNISKKFKTPYNALLLTSAIIIISIFLQLKILIEAASLVLILTNIISCISVIILRESRLQNYRPKFKSPLYPWLQIFGIIFLILLIFQMGLEGIIITLFFIISGILTYLFYGRIKGYKEYALLHLIENITAKELTSYTLETELKEILYERDEIKKDRFDKLVESSIIIDMDKKTDKLEFFRISGELLTKKLKLSNKTIKNLLLKRENESSTAITPFTAVPHIIIKGQKKFNLLIARNKYGISFSEDAPEVKAIFILMGTKDERNFHLRALSYIAQIIQNSKFEKNWLTAKNEKYLKDIILLGSRTRKS